MKNKKAIIFDFDGTLFDSRIGIISGVKAALDYLDIAHPNEEVLTSFIGPPLGKSFKQHFNLSDNDVQIAITKLREYYGVKGIYESVAYEGMEELLQALLANNKSLAIATAKPTVYANRILTEKKWDRYFTSVQGSSLSGELYPKKRTIQQAVVDLKVFEKEEAVMIGDTLYDIKGAEEVGVQSIAVNYGYGKQQDLKDARPAKLVQTVEELHALLL